MPETPEPKKIPPERGKPIPTTDPVTKYPDHNPKVGDFYLVKMRHSGETHRLRYVGLWDEFICFYETLYVREHPNSKPEPFEQIRRIYKFEIAEIDDAPPADAHEVF